FRFAQSDHEQSKGEQTPGREFLQQMRNVKEQRLRTMNALMKASAEFVQNNVFVKSIDKTHPENHPKTKQGARSNPRNPSAPCIGKIGTPVSEQLIKNKWWENECPNNRPLDEHGPGQHYEKHGSKVCRPARPTADFCNIHSSARKSNNRL